ncbi:deaminase [Paractinoplanes deccanensis]|uniref:Deaminase n=1 Tax=Paractinoplanes deccanensis TaxID=113561 RepID=A0ABQ3XXE2_9ACTN|nr:dihydrofolate reductase family protein [Actinoplanes deccanensis]GID72421.1 deaminase [Actinoplanes deccanensis]
MGKLIYSMITSVDGYVCDEDGNFGWGVPDEESHRFIGERSKSVGTYLMGRRMYEVMSYWETAHELAGEPAVVHEFARVWQAADKVVYSTTLTGVTTGRTRLERTFEPEAVRKLKESDDRDITIEGPTLAAQAVKAGLVDEYQLIVAPALAGGGTPFFPQGVRAELELIEDRSFPNGMAFLRYAVK